MTENQVFGAIAGANAAKKALSSPGISISQECIASVTNRIQHILSRKKGLDPSELNSEITKVMSLYVGVLRHEDGLQKAARSLSDIRECKINHLSRGGEPTFRMLSKVFEVENILLIGELVTLAATMRRETRGAHNREDYPRMDEEWPKNIVFQMKNGKMTVGTKPVAAV